MSSFFEVGHGTVEDVNDPLGNARVKVRIDGYHTQLDARGDSYGLPVEDLDWYPVLMPTTSSSRNGVGHSPSGLCKGDRVVVHILDEFIQSVLVVGTIHGDNDISDIAFGDIEGMESASVENTNNNIAKAPKLDSREYDRDMMEVDDVGFDLFFESLVYEEGFRSKPYYDQFKYPTIGIGTLLIRQRNYPLEKSWEIVERRLGRRIPERQLSYEEAKRMALQDLKKFENEINNHSLLSSVYNTVSKTRQYALLSMCYQMGTGGVAKFKNSLNLMLQEDWEGVYRNLLKSLWAKQTPLRATRVASVIRDNNFSVYPKEVQRKALSSMNTDGLSSESDLTEVQLMVINSTKPLRAFKGIKSYEDIRSLYDIIVNFDAFIAQLNDAMNNLGDKVKTLKDINIVDFITRYIDRFTIFLDKLLKQVINFIETVVDDAIEAIKAMAKLIELLIKQIIHNIKSSINGIDRTVDNVMIDWSEEVNEEEEAEGGLLFSEPVSEYAGEYPHVKTIISPGGHIQEYDDTPGFERIREQHKAGSYREINADGRIVEKSVADKYVFVNGDDHLFIEGSGKITIGGSHIIHIIGDSQQVINGDVKQVVRGESYTEVAQNSTVRIMGDTDVKIDGDTKLLIEGKVDGKIIGTTDLHCVDEVSLYAESHVGAQIMGNTEVFTEGQTYVYSKDNISIDADSNVYVRTKGNLEHTVNGNMTSTVDGEYKIKVGGNLQINASRINMDGN